MNIKQVEELTGIAKQNIRFYEKENLITPKRNEGNGYREYDENDVRGLLLIKMLRKLGMPLDEIRLVLKGKDMFEEAIRRQRESLEEEKDHLDAAIKICRELEQETPDTLDVEKVLERIQEEERQGKRFANIWDDFRMVVAAEEKKKFSFMPDTLIQNPREFTEELLRYARQSGGDITITRESMYPQFILNGVEYSAMRVCGRYGAVVQCEMMHPELVEPKEVPGGRRKWMKLLARVLPVLIVFSIAAFSMVRAFSKEPAWVGILTAVGATALFFATFGVYHGLKD